MLTPHALLESLNIKPEEKATAKLVAKIVGKIKSSRDLKFSTTYRNLDIYEIVDIDPLGNFKTKRLGGVHFNKKPILSVLTEIMDWVQPKKGGSDE